MSILPSLALMGMAHTTAYYQYGLMVEEDGLGGIVRDVYGVNLLLDVITDTVNPY